MARTNPYIEKINLSRCAKLTDEGLKIIASACRHLTHVNIAYCGRITDEAVVFLARIRNALEGLDIGNCRKVTEASAAAIATLTALQSLGINGMSWTNEQLLPVLQSCPDLEHLSMCGTAKLGPPTLQALADHCPRLKSIEMEQCEVTDNALGILSRGCTRLKHARIVRCPHVSGEGIRQFGVNANRLVSLTCEKMLGSEYDGAMGVLATAAHRTFRKLDFTICRSLTQLGVTQLVQLCSRLTELRIEECKEAVTDAALRAIGERCHFLQVLSIRKSEKCTGRGVAALARCKALRELYLSQCINIGPEGIGGVARACRSLEVLEMRMCFLTDDSCLSFIAQHLTRLRTLDITGCFAVQLQAMEEVLKLPRLEQFLIVAIPAALPVVASWKSQRPHVDFGL